MTTDAQMPERIWAFEDGEGAIPRGGYWCDEQSESPDGSPCYVRADLCASGQVLALMEAADRDADRCAGQIAELEAALEKARAEAAPDDRSADMAECFMFSVGYEAGERDGRAAAIKQAGIQREKGDHNQAPLDQAPQPAGEAGQEGWRLRDWSDDSWQWEPTPQPSVSVAEALKPFADFASAPSFDRLPDDMPITQGSRLAKKQVTAGDFKRALVALRALKGGEAND